MQLNFFVGTAAELIKLYPVIHKAQAQGHQVRVIASGQSRENFVMQYRDLNLPDSSLTWLMSGGSDLRKSSSALLWFMRAIFTRKSTFRKKLLPSEILIVHGDTLSTLIGAWFGWRCGLKVVHIEAGLRSPKILNPFPEEITRRLVSLLATIHMAPDEAAVENLRHVSGDVINTHGNTLLEAVQLCASERSAPSHSFALVNIHRYENLNSEARWSAIVDTVVKAAATTKLIFVAHPQTMHKLRSDAQALKALTQPRIEIRERMPFSEFIWMLRSAQYLISDGGSNQEECSYLGKPCLLLRESTERREGLKSCCVLSRFEPQVIAKFLENPRQYATPPQEPVASPSQIILDRLVTGS